MLTPKSVWGIYIWLQDFWDYIPNKDENVHNSVKCNKSRTIGERKWKSERYSFGILYTGYLLYIVKIKREREKERGKRGKRERERERGKREEREGKEIERERR